MNNEYKLMEEIEEEEEKKNSNYSDLIKIGVPVVGGIIGAVVAGPILGPTISTGIIVAKFGLGSVIASASATGLIVGDISRRLTEKAIHLNMVVSERKDNEKWRKFYSDFIKSDNCPIFVIPVCFKKDIKKYVKQILKSDSDNSLGKLNSELMKFYKDRRVLFENKNYNNLMTIKDAQNYSKYLCRTFNHVFEYMDSEDKEVCFNTIQNYVFTNVYNNVIYAYYDKFGEKDEIFYKKCIKMRRHLPKDVKKISHKLPLKKTYKKFLKHFEQSHTPSKKLNSIVHLVQMIGNESPDLTADDLISALIFMLVKYSPTRIYSNLGFIDDFRNHTNNGLYEYIYVTFFCAVKAVHDLKRYKKIKEYV
jgi:L-rhamnose mutarotase